MTESLHAEKSRLRTRIRAELKKISDEHRRHLSLAACQLLKRQPIWSSANSILLYAPFADEVAVWELGSEILASGKVLALPQFNQERGHYIAAEVKIHEKRLKTGQFGIREPDESCPLIELKRLDLVFVPGVAFDLAGRRLGRGKGFYDQLLKLVRGTTVGVAFDEQIVSEVPTGPDDVPVNCILTPTRWIVCDATTRGF
jgi:5-formyltetrahydrofolate cyclo-ligase